MALHVITTGGTIDKVYDPINGELIVGSPVIGNILSNVPWMKDEYYIESLYAIDSLEMTSKERYYIADSVILSKDNWILITHGTDTIHLTAKYLDENLPIPRKDVIVLLGSMIPYGFPGSDALINVGGFLNEYSQKTLGPGIYIAMHGRVIKYKNYVKNPELGQFEIKR